MAKKILVVTDNRSMATTIAKAVGYTEKDMSSTFYEGGDVEILWTGGALMKLILKHDTPQNIDCTAMSAEEIARTYYTAVPRSYESRIAGLDKIRLQYIEDALGYCDEVVFMCQPTDEEERLIQAIKLFFGISIKTRTVVLDKMQNDSILTAIHSETYHERLTMFLSANAMRRNVINDISRLNSITVGVEKVSLKAMRLYQTIKNCENIQNKFLADKPRKVRIGKLLDLDSLFCAMAVKYDMVIDSLWDSLVYLYAIGLINNPMTRLATCPHEWLAGAGNPEKESEEDLNLDHAALLGAIIPVAPVDYGLAGIEYYPEEAPDAFIPRTAAIYRHIIRQAQRIKEKKDSEYWEYPSASEDRRTPLSTVYEWFIATETASGANSIEESFGKLIFELEVADLIEMTDGLVAIRTYTGEA